MRRFWLLSLLLLPQLGRTQGDGGPLLDEVRQLMNEGLERDLPSPSPHAAPQWPNASESPRPVPRGEPGAARVQALTERVRTEASMRARALAEERRTVPDNQPGAGQARTRAAKTVGPPDRPRPPKP